MTYMSSSMLVWSRSSAEPPRPLGPSPPSAQAFIGVMRGEWAKMSSRIFRQIPLIYDGALEPDGIIVFFRDYLLHRCYFQNSRNNPGLFLTWRGLPRIDFCRIKFANFFAHEVGTAAMIPERIPGMNGEGDPSNDQLSMRMCR